VSRLLFVDDEASLLTVLRVYFESDGHEVRLAPGLGAARALLAEERFDAVVADQRLGPRGNEGLALLAEVRGRDRHTATVLLTGALHDDLRNEARRTGIHLVLEKPQPLPALAVTLEALLEAVAQEDGGLSGPEAPGPRGG
jgi:DNA-binding NtrC family response regulator